MRNTVRRWCRQFIVEDEGANLVEAALILPPILIVIFGTMEYGAVLYVQIALQNGVSQATRYAITRQADEELPREQSIRRVLQRETPTLTIDDGDVTFSHIPPGGSSWVEGTGPSDSIERVAVTYQWPLMTPFMDLMFSTDTLTLRAESAMKNESELIE